MAFGDIVRQSDSKFGDSNNLGGDADTIWIAEDVSDGTGYEVASADFSILSSAPLDQLGETYGFGGSTNVLFWVQDVYKELSTADFSTIRTSNNTLPTFPHDIDADEDIIWETYDEGSGVYGTRKRSTSDFSVISNYTNENWYGIGGNGEGVYSTYNAGVFQTDIKLTQNSTNDFSIINEVGAPADALPTTFEPLGGTIGSLWALKDGVIYELDTPLQPPTAPTNLTVTLQ